MPGEEKKDELNELDVKKEAEKVDEAIDKITLSKVELESKIKAEVEAATKTSISTEKDKLYSNMEALKKKNREFEDQLNSLAKEKRELEEYKEKERLAKMSTEEKAQDELKKATERIEQLNTSFNVLKQETDDKLLTKDLELYREKLIAQATGNIIPELVRGTSREELEVSYKMAVERFKSIKADVEKGIKETLKDDLNTEVSTETPNQTRKTPPKNEKMLSALEIRNLPPEKYKQYKEEVLSKYGL